MKTFRSQGFVSPMTPPSSTPTLDLGTCACGPPSITLLAGPDGELTVPWHLNCERGKAAFARALAAELATLGDAEFADDLENLADELDDLCAERRIEALDCPRHLRSRLDRPGCGVAPP